MRCGALRMVTNTLLLPFNQVNFSFSSTGECYTMLVRTV